MTQAHFRQVPKRTHARNAVKIYDVHVLVTTSFSRQAGSTDHHTSCQLPVKIIGFTSRTFSEYFTSKGWTPVLSGVLFVFCHFLATVIRRKRLIKFVISLHGAKLICAASVQRRAATVLRKCTCARSARINSKPSRFLCVGNDLQDRNTIEKHPYKLCVAHVLRVLSTHSL